MIFYSGTWTGSSVKEEFPDVEIIYCSFHISNALRERLINDFGKPIFEEHAFAQWYSVLRKFFFAPYVQNTLLIDEMKNFVDGLKSIILMLIMLNSHLLTFHSGIAGILLYWNSVLSCISFNVKNCPPKFAEELHCKIYHKANY